MKDEIGKEFESLRSMLKFVIICSLVEILFSDKKNVKKKEE